MSASIAQRLLGVGRGDGLRARLIRGAMGVGGLQLLSIPLMLATSVLLARGLGPEGFGRYAFITSLLMVLALPLDQGMRQLVTREVAGYHHTGQWALFRGLIRRTHQWVLAGAALLVAALGVVAVSQATWRVDDRWTLLLVALGTLPFLGLNALRGATLRGLGHVVKAQLPELLVRPGTHLVVAGALLVLGLLNPVTALAGYAAAATAAFVIGAVLLRRHWPKEVRAVAADYRSGQWARAWAPFTLLMAVSMLNNQIGILLLGWLGTDEQVAALRVADRGAQLVAMSLAVVNLVIAPQITRAYRDDNRNRLQVLSTQSARAALAIALPVALPLILLGGPIIGLIFGAEYVDSAVTPLAVLTAAQLVNVTFGSVGMFLAMSGYERDTLFGHVVALILNALAALVLIPSFGADGAAYAAAAGLVTWNLVLAVKVVQRLGLRPSAF